MLNAQQTHISINIQDNSNYPNTEAIIGRSDNRTYKTEAFTVLTPNEKQNSRATFKKHQV
ncbi:hypothetical protein T4B_1466 [Trichinella pseudospiralis]|uniref:Uncharacterized protein n=1 Tax=Trichinella pseudospiralis TaxID=6337 RepID=A0A0V1IM75_TRIPS|nr:hypothetical protein T4B_1466 [Trichinella pseudospiralis]